MPSPEGPVAGLLADFAAGRQRPSEVVDALLAASARDELGAYVSVAAERARAAAAAADVAWGAGRAGALCGVPLALKDNIDVAGAVTGCDHLWDPPRGPATADATVVAALRAAGAVLLGKTRLHELALGITGLNPRFGTPANPRDATRLPGGSSSGSAVAVAAGLCTAAIGTDTGGSVRVPAALCGVVGFKPGFGWIDCEGVFPLAPSIDHVGLITSTVADAELLYRALAAQRADGAAALAWPPRVGLLGALTASAAPEVAAAVRRALAASGLAVAEVETPGADELLPTYGTLLAAEAAAVHAAALAGAAETFGSDVRAVLERGRALEPSQIASARRRRRALAGEYAALLAGTPILACPTTLVPAPRRDQQQVSLGARRLTVRQALLCNTCPFSLLGLPAISIPVRCGRLPVGLQLIAAPGQEIALLRAAAAVEAAASEMRGQAGDVARRAATRLAPRRASSSPPSCCRRL